MPRRRSPGLPSAAVRASFVAADIADLAAQPGLVEAAFGAFGRIDCLVNNAGVSVLSRGDLLDVALESYDRCLAVNNLRAPFFLTQRIRPADAGGNAACRRAAALDRHDHLGQCRDALAEPRRVLHLQGRRLDG